MEKLCYFHWFLNEIGTFVHLQGNKSYKKHVKAYNLRIESEMCEMSIGEYNYPNRHVDVTNDNKITYNVEDHGWPIWPNA